MVNANLNQPGWSFVYFIQAGENGPIKIGATGDPSGRLRALRTANAAPLKCPERHVLSQFTSDDWDRFVDECPRPKVSSHRPSGRWDYPGVIMSWLDRSADGENDLMK